MNQSKPFIAVLCVLLVAAPGAFSQQLNDRAPTISSERSHWYSGFTNRYQPRYVPPISLSNSGRADSLVRAGNLYLSLSDAIALALENNIDVEVSRYSYPLADTALFSANAGGNGVPNLDPVFISNINAAHNTQISASTVTTGQIATTNNNKLFNFGVQQGFITGGTATLGLNSNQSLSSGAITFNPAYNSSLQLQINQPLLNGFGLALNRRFIRIAKNNIRATDFQFEQQLNTTLNTVIATYWNLVSAALAVGVAQQSLELSQKLLDDNKKQLEIGTMAPLDVQQADQQVATSETNLIIAQTAVEQQEVALKNLLSRNGLGAANFADVHIIATDRITVPDVEPIQPVQDLVAKALDKRPELGQQRLQLENSKITLSATKNSLLPSINLTSTLTNAGLGGEGHPSFNPQTGNFTQPNPFFVGGFGTALGQIFSRNFPTYSIGAQLNIPLRNRSAQAAYITQDLQLRQSELAIQKQINQVRMDVQNALIAVKNARARYQSATKASALAEAVLDSEQKKYALGASTSYAVVQHQTDLATARQAEVTALSTYALAKLQMDQATGTILDNNNVVLDEAKNGRLSKTPSRIPDVLPDANGRAAVATPVAAPAANR